MNAKRVLEIVATKGYEFEFERDATGEEKREFLSYVFTEVADGKIDNIFTDEQVLQKLLEDCGMKCLYPILHNPDAIFRDEGNLMINIVFWAIFECNGMHVGDVKIVAGNHSKDAMEFYFKKST